MSKSVLYDSEFYSTMVKKLNAEGKFNQLYEFKEVFAEANLLYEVGGRCVLEVGSGNTAASAIKDNKILYAVLKESLNGMEMLQNVLEYEKKQPQEDGYFLHMLEGSIKACNRHLKELSKKTSSR